MNMKTVILAAGKGNRMWPLTENRPKAMLPVAGKPVMEHLVAEAIGAGLNDFIFVVGHCGETIREYFGNGSQLKIKITYIEQNLPRGTSEAIELVKDEVGSKFLVINGDNIVKSTDINRLIESDITCLGVKQVDNPFGLGVVETRGKRIVRIHEKVEKPPTKLANAGLYLFTSDIIDAISRTPVSSRGEYELPGAIQTMLDAGIEVRFHEVDTWLEMSYPWDVLSVNERLMTEIKGDCMGTIEENVFISGNTQIGCDTLLRSGTYIEGPVIIGDGCDIGPNCYIRGSTAIGDKCRIGAGVEIKNSVIMKNTRIPHLSYIGDSVIGENCNLGAGTNVANLRFDHRDVAVNHINSQRRKLGLISGNNVSTGINVSINTGTIIGSGITIKPGAIAKGVISSGSRVF